MSLLRRFFTVPVSIFFSCCFLIFSHTESVAQTFNPAADAYVRNGSYATTNYGTATSLAVNTSSTAGTSKNTLLRFNVSGINAASITSVTLRLYVTTTASITIGAYPIDSSWKETTVNWNTALSTGALLVGTAISGKGKYYTWDVTKHVKDSMVKGGAAFCFLMKDIATNSKDVIFSSRESSSNKPQLVFTTVTVPSTPGTLSATAASSSQINLSWTDNASNETGYKVEAKTANGSYAVVATLGANINSYSHTGLSPLTSYTYRVYAYNGSGNSLNSNEATAITTSGVAGTSYYIDAVGGNDNNNGTSPSTPWKNLTKLNALTLAAGTRVYLRSGSTWTGQQLKFKGSGTLASPIVINKYDLGAKPLLHGNGLVGQGVVYLYNQQFIEISNLEITNDPNGPNNANYFLSTNPNGGDRRGVMVVIDSFGTAEHIYLKKLDIHHVKGQLGSGETAVNGAIPKRTGGIFFTVLGATETSAAKSRFNDVLVDSCNIYYCENIGFAIDNEWNVYYPGGQNSTLSSDVTEYNNWYNRRNSNLKISNSVFHHIGKNAMIIRMADSSGRIEYNTCYETAMGTTGNTMFTARCKGTVFQFNEGYYNRATTQTVNPGSIDGSMYDADYGSVGVIFQYSYSHDNSEGLWWGCNTRNSTTNTSGVPDPGDVGVTVRYNISQNDKGDLIFFNYPSAGNEIYNNVFYIGSGLSSNIIHESSNNHTYNFYNNIIYNNSSTADYAFKDVNQNRTISNNIFFGNHPTGTLTGEPADPNKITTNPLFVSPGVAGTGLSALTGYQLQSGSPAINSGLSIPNNGGKDFWGNVLYSGSPDRGAHEFYAALLRSRGLAGVSEANLSAFSVFPNPLKGNAVTLTIPASLKDKNLRLNMLDGGGHLVWEQAIVSGAGFFTTMIPSQVPNGLYLLQLSSGNIRHALPLMVSR